jgi:hypothetical protein
MPPAEPPAGRRPEDPRAPGDAPSRAARPMSRDDLFGPSGPFGVSGTPATPPGAGGSGFEPPEDADPTRVVNPDEESARPLRSDDEPTRALTEDEPTRAYRPGYRAEFRPDDGPTRAFPAQPPVASPQPAPPLRPAQPPPDDPTRVYEPGGEYRPGQYQPRSMSGGYQRGDVEQGAYTPGQYQSGYSSQETMGYPSDAGGGAGWAQGGESGDSGGRRPWVVGAAVGVLVVAIAAGGAYALLGREDGSPSSAGATTSPQASVPSEGTAEPSASESAEPSQEPGESPSPSAAAAGEPIPDEPWTDDSLDFGFLTKVTRKGDQIRLTFNRAVFYYGDEATEKNGGTPPDNDYLIEDTNKKTRTFDLVADAPLEGSSQLGGTRTGPEGVPITEDELVANMRSLAGNNPQGVPVWLRHEGGGKSGPVTALAEQFVP